MQSMALRVLTGVRRWLDLNVQWVAPRILNWFRKFSVALAFVVGLLPSQPLSSKEFDVESKIVSVALFKNGLAMIKRQVLLEAPGTYRFTDVVQPVHGTFFIEGASKLVARVETRPVSLPQSLPLGTNPQTELAGMMVTIRTRGGQTPIVGKVFPIVQREKGNELNDNLFASPLPALAAPHFLVINNENGMSYVDIGEIVSLDAKGQPSALTQIEQRPVLLLETGEDFVAGTAQISYLTHGLSWAPSYKIDLLNATQMRIEQQAVIRNEIMDLNDTKLSVISGFPNIEFAHAISPLAASQSWNQFFQQLGSGLATPSRRQSVLAQNASFQNAAFAEPEMPVQLAPTSSETIDLYYHPIGNHSLKRNTSMALTIGKSETEYEQIIDWRIVKTRDDWGNTQPNQQIDQNTGEPLQDDVWDSIRFRNRFPFPMTSAPSMVLVDGQFKGQGQTLWTNQNEIAVLRINRALSVHARDIERESQQNERNSVTINHQTYRKVTVDGELRFSNRRTTNVRMLIKKQFSGSYVKADDSPKVNLREEGIRAVNPRNELIWEIPLTPGEERTIQYQYTGLFH